jgi:predicted nucleic acid-binding protein
MILADTAIWIEFLRGHEPILSTLTDEIDAQNIIATECVFGELLQGAKNQRERGILQDYWLNLPKKNELGLWLDAGVLSSQEGFFTRGVGLIDAFLVVFARKYKAKIWTLDKKLNGILKNQEKYIS